MALMIEQECYENGCQYLYWKAEAERLKQLNLTILQQDE